MNLLQDVQYYDKYSRFDYASQRREDWHETVTRVVDYLWSFDKENVLAPELKDRIWQAIYDKKIMPSMRNLAMAGEAARRQNASSYNCAYTVISDLFSFREAVIILMSGTGLGYSVESHYVDMLPTVKPQTGDSVYYLIEDSTEGWADAVYVGLISWFDGLDVTFDYSQIRPAGSPLKVKGGRASGPAILEQSLNKIRSIVLAAQGYKIRSIDAHDIMCHLAACIVSGGVRRSAMIALFDFDDQDMLLCKSPENIKGNEQRYFANNSAVWLDTKTENDVEKFMTNMFATYMGEPGIFSRVAAKNTIPTRRSEAEFGLNPCAEIFLRPYQFCNLSSVVCRETDSVDDLLEKVELATIIGTLQSLSIYFPGLRKEWVINQIEERLLGVDLNGIMDVALVRNPLVLSLLKDHAIRVNAKYAALLNINQSAAITCVKPSGNSSLFLDTSPGIHTRWSDYYIRRIELHKDNPILEVLRFFGVPTEKAKYKNDTFLAEFPIKAPAGAITNGHFSAIEQLENWKLFKSFWTEHNPSVTITYEQNEQEAITKWVYENQAIIGGISFLPKSDAHYEQMPYEKISPERYDSLIETFPEGINWEVLHELEKGFGDLTNAASVAACSGDKCLIEF